VKLSVKVEYACRVLAQLARVYGHQELSHIEALARLEKIPANYLAQILAELRNGGLILSRRGKLGGYALARPPEEVSLFDITKVLDGELLEMGLQDTGESGGAVVRAWQQVQQAMVEELKTINLQSMISDEEGGMYYI
jgi:Rrf2 family transcriptional regulator, cysteine metabolism repressor